MFVMKEIEEAGNISDENEGGKRKKEIVKLETTTNKKEKFGAYHVHIPSG